MASHPWRTTVAACALALSSVGARTAYAGWTTESPLPLGTYQTRTVAGGGYVYKLGGLGEHGVCGTREVQYARLNADGTVGAWAPTTALPSVGTSTLTVTCANTAMVVDDVVIGWGFEAAYLNGFVYLIGGNRWSFTGFPDGLRIHFSGDVYYAPVAADGSLGAWRYTASLSTASFMAAAATDGGTIYLTGGRDSSSGPNVRREVFTARPNADGSLSGWAVAPDLMPAGLWLHAAAVAAGRLYVSGGVTYLPFPPNQITDAVFSAPLAADGTPGAWRTETSLPIGLAGHGMKQRHGILYTLAGQEPNYPSVSVHVSTPGAGGALPAWTDADPLPVPLFTVGAAAAGQALYVDGGTDGSYPQKAVYRLPDTIPPAPVADLAASAVDAYTLSLGWTAPGNDGSYGAVVGGRYQLALTAGGVAAPAQSLTASFAPGDAQTWRVSGLTPGTDYALTLTAFDESGNASAPSNAAAARTFSLVTSTEVPPVVSLQTPTTGLSIVAVSAASFGATPGDALGAAYRISPDAPLAPGLLSFRVAPSALKPGTALYEYQAGVGWSSAAVSGQTIDATTGILTAALSRTGAIAAFAPAAPVPPPPPPPPPPSGVVFSALFDPQTLNLGSNGRVVHATLEAVSGARAKDILPSSVRLSAVDGAPAALAPTGCQLQEPDLICAFDRAAVAARLTAGLRVLTFSGALTGGRSFSSTATVTALSPQGAVASGVPAGAAGASNGIGNGNGSKPRFWPAPQRLLDLARDDDAASAVVAAPRRRVARGRAGVTVPREAIAETVALTVSTAAADTAADAPDRERKIEEAGLKAASPAVSYGPEGTRFATPVTLELAYDRASLPAGVTEDSLTVHYWNPSSKAWEALPSFVDRAAQVVRAQTSHFSLYQLFSAPASALPAAVDQSFGLKAVYAFPNPVRGGAAPTIRVQPGQADSVEVRIYDAAGRKVHSSSAFAVNPNLDDGNGLGAQITYDHVWDTAGVGSGVYTFVVTARKAGQSDLHKTGRIGVVK